MATIEELVKQYHEDPEFKKEVQDILADGQITIEEFTTFAKKHKVNVSLLDLPMIIAEAKNRGRCKACFRMDIPRSGTTRNEKREL